jgi:hypothetical protein
MAQQRRRLMESTAAAARAPVAVLGVPLAAIAPAQPFYEHVPDPAALAEVRAQRARAPRRR